ncbi:MAG: hypothetical protein ACOCUS_05275 [Polyangiales bacterium]
MTNEPDVRDTQPTKVVLAAAAFQVLTGLSVVLTGLQPMLFGVRYRDIFDWMPWVLVVAGVIAMVFGAAVGRAREWAAVSGAALSVVLLLGMLAWLVANLMWGVFSCPGMLAVPLALAASVLGVLAVKPCMRATEARRRLRDEGMELGF